MVQLRLFHGWGIALALVLLASCGGKDDPVPSDPGFTSFVLYTAGKSHVGLIDPGSGDVTVGGIAEPSAITSVTYTLSEGATVYPAPESLIGRWPREQAFLLSAGSYKRSVRVVLSEYEQAPDRSDAVIYPDVVYGRVLDKFFFDAKGRPNYLVTESNARRFFYEDGMNGLRIPVYGDAVAGGHPSEGVVEESVYTNIVKSVVSTRKYCSGDFTIMASKKLEGKTSFPEWVMDADGVNPVKYAGLLLDYLRFMKGKDIEIDVLGIDNETNYNEGNVTPERFKTIVDRVRSGAAEAGLKVPKFIGPERYSPELNTSGSWIKSLFDNGWSDRLDIYGTHYYPSHHQTTYYSALQFEVDYASSDGREREFWATEPHWSAISGQDELVAAEQALCALWDMTDIGLDAFMWWDYNLSETFRTSLMKAVSLAMFHSRPVQMTDHDGTDNMQPGKLQTRAFLREDGIKVFAVNVQTALQPSSSLERYVFEVKDMLVGSIRAERWSDTTGTDPENVEVTKLEDGRFRLDLPSRSITIITINIQ